MKTVIQKCYLGILFHKIVIISGRFEQGLCSVAPFLCIFKKDMKDKMEKCDQLWFSLRQCQSFYGSEGGVEE